MLTLFFARCPARCWFHDICHADGDIEACPPRCATLSAGALFLSALLAPAPLFMLLSRRTDYDADNDIEAALIFIYCMRTTLLRVSASADI